jgi:hypothetical protein
MFRAPGSIRARMFLTHTGSRLQTGECDNTTHAVSEGAFALYAGERTPEPYTRSKTSRESLAMLISWNLAQFAADESYCTRKPIAT